MLCNAPFLKRESDGPVTHRIRYPNMNDGIQIESEAHNRAKLRHVNSQFFLRPLPAVNPSDERRFFAMLDVRGPNECWPYVGYTNRAGYGMFSLCGEPFISPRVAFKIFSRDPHELIVCHHCDNPSCCNPAHLYAGTLQDNSSDAVERGRYAWGDRSGSRTHPECRPRGDNHPYRRNPMLAKRGEESGMAKLTDEKVREIRAMYASGGHTYRSIAKIIQIGKTAVGNILEGKSWTHLL